ncbi:MAG: PKD domain-containing protein [Actinomycetota bacterium]
MTKRVLALREGLQRGRLGLLLAGLLIATLLSAVQAPAVESPVPVASGWTTVKFPGPQPACTGVGFQGSVYYDRLDCGFGYVQVTETNLVQPNRSVVKVSFIDSSGVTRNTQTTTARTADNAWQFNITPGANWTPGTVTVRVTEVDVDGGGGAPNQVGNFGETSFILNQLGASLGVLGSPQPGEDVSVSGNIYEIDQIPPLAAPQQQGVPAIFRLRAVLPDGSIRGPFAPITANSSGDFTATIPGSATDGLTADASTNYEIALSIEAVNATYTDFLTGAWAADRAGAAPLVITIPPPTLIVQNSFVSAVGWVKPGDSYPSRVFVKNYTPNAAANVQVTIPAADGMVFTNATPATGADGTAASTATSVTWTIPSVPAGTSAGPAVKTLVVDARADTIGEDAQIVWKNLSTTATLTYTGGPSGLTSASHGPKVIPPKETFDTARYGDRPFPVVPVDWFERKHESTHTGDRLAKVINSPGVAGSTWNLYQEMSYGQLFPNGTVPSAGIATKGWAYGPGFDFTTPAPQGACAGTSYKDFRDTALYPERIHDGWYQMPGDTQYYGGDKFSAGSLAGAIGGVGLLFAIDDACGPTGKAVYDAAQIADPELDYSDYDTDKDGVVDFFMMVFPGLGGNGASQLNVPPYDNIWPHSSSLEFYYSDPATGLKGYISDDQLKNLKGEPVYYTTSARTATTTAMTAWPVYVRVGPYNVNPESAVEHASVISHEYGHSLGLPDYYSLGDRETYGDWNLMATDKSQNMDNHAIQELGWMVPRVLEPGLTTVTEWVDSKVNTHRIDWKDANNNPYTLSGPGVNNGEGYVAKLPSRQIIDPAEVPSPAHVWWSRSGNDFGCTPQGAHNLDIVLPDLETLPSGTPVTVTFKSKWDIEWDFDYGFVMISRDNGETYQSLPSQNNYTTATFNPTANACQAQYGNGLTGTSGSYDDGTQEADRLIGVYPEGGFLDDEYTFSSDGSATVLRFSYATDPGLARPGWFIDDLRITAGDQVLYETDFESSADPDDPRVFNGGCKDQTRSAAQCTDGWQYVSATDGSPADHAYYMVLRDRSSFDLEGRGQNDRDPIAFLPGLLLVYNDEAHGYGNFGVDDPPAVSPLDSQPQPGSNTPNLGDAAWTDVPGDNSFSDSDVGHTDNYADPGSDDGNWHFQFNCLSFNVNSMAGEETIGPLNPPYDLIANVSITVGAGCAPFDYGYEGGNFNVSPTAVAQARPNPAVVGEEVTFDGSASTDDGPSSELRYRWDFDGNGSYDATGQVQHHTYTAGGTYNARLEVTDTNGTGLSDTDTIAVAVISRADLQVTSLVASNSNARQGEKVTFTATVANSGGSTAAPSQTEFKLEPSTVIGVVATGSIPAGGSQQVAVDLRTNNMQGQHVMRATADVTNVVNESNETNNSAQRTFTIKGNKVSNGSFEQSSSGSAPDSWSGSSTGAGSASYSQSGGTEGSKAASTSGNGGNALVNGSPSWTSDPVAVVPGEVLDLVVFVNVAGASSAPSAGLIYLGPLGNVLNTVTLITAPLSTQGFRALENTVTVPAGVANVRIALKGFAPTDLVTTGTVKFDDVGLFAH